MSPVRRQAAEACDLPGDLALRILDAARAAGLDVDRLTVDDLAPVDEFHIRGREATEELAALVGLTGDERVLDVGCGLGGSARHLVARYGVRVTGVDICSDHCRVGRLLNERTGLAQRVELVTADALALPFANGGFDVVWTEHAVMNIADKPRCYGELRRVLRTGGRLAVYDVLEGPGPGPPRFPVPWARTPESSFLLSPVRLRALLERSGFQITAWRDLSAYTLGWYRARANETPPALGTHLLMGPDARDMIANLARNLARDRVRVVQLLAEAR
jgi:ubiquinone/menaquinone biosynthesis C-methylase UbiE